MQPQRQQNQRRYSMADRALGEVDVALRTIFAPAVSSRPFPDDGVADACLDDGQRADVQGLMRVNHAGEVCAQALYQGQALTSRSQAARAALREASREETDHLAWTERRVRELGGAPSLLNPLWYLGSLAIGVAAGVLGDRWNLGFLAETERQVGAHLDRHLQRLPESDLRSRAILAQMSLDEAGHARTAVALGAAELPGPVKGAMTAMSRVMTGIAYRL